MSKSPYAPPATDEIQTDSAVWRDGFCVGQMTMSIGVFAVVFAFGFSLGALMLSAEKITGNIDVVFFAIVVGLFFSGGVFITLVGMHTDNSFSRIRSR